MRVSEPRISPNATLIRPQATIARRILNYSTHGLVASFSFEPVGIRFDNTREIIPYTQSISLRLFETHRIKQLSFKPGIKPTEMLEKQISEFLLSGKMRSIESMIQDVTILPPVEQMIKEKQPLIDLPVRLQTIPGEFHHYTDQVGYERIMKTGILRTSSFAGRSPRICLTPRSLSEHDAWSILFIAQPQYADLGRGDYVIGFDFMGLPVLYKPDTPIEEYWSRIDLKFGRDIKLRFAGLNPVA